MSQRPLILVVDDEASMRELLIEVLVSDGYTVRAVENGQRALEVLGEARPDVVLLDLMMPVLDGWAFIESYRDAAGTEIPIIGISAVRPLPGTARAAATLPAGLPSTSSPSRTSMRHLGEHVDDRRTRDEGAMPRWQTASLGQAVVLELPCLMGNGDPLLPDDVSTLSLRYEVARSDVLIDARLVEHWQAPEPELREELSRRHQWPRDRGARYLLDLRHALGRRG